MKDDTRASGIVPPLFATHRAEVVLTLLTAELIRLGLDDTANEVDGLVQQRLAAFRNGEAA